MNVSEELTVLCPRVDNWLSLVQSTSSYSILIQSSQTSLGLPHWPLSFRCKHHSIFCTSHPSCECYLHSPPHNPWFYRITIIWWTLQSYGFPHSLQSSPPPTPPGYFHSKATIILLSTCDFLKIPSGFVLPLERETGVGHALFFWWRTSTKKSKMKLPNSTTRVGTLIVATIYLQLIQNRYIFRSSTVLQCSHQHCVQPVASDVEVVGYL